MRRRYAPLGYRKNKDNPVETPRSSSNGRNNNHGHIVKHGYAGHAGSVGKHDDTGHSRSRGYIGHAGYRETHDNIGHSGNQGSGYIGHVGYRDTHNNIGHNGNQGSGYIGHAGYNAKQHNQGHIQKHEYAAHSVYYNNNDHHDIFTQNVRNVRIPNSHDPHGKYSVF